MLGASHPEQLAAEFEAAGLWREETLALWLQRCVERSPDHRAISATSDELTYAQLWQAARGLAAGLRRAGLQRDEVVAVQLPNSAEFAIAYLAVGLCGAVFQTVHMPYRASEISLLLSHSGASMAIVPSRIKEYLPAEVLDGLRATLPKLRDIVVVGAPQPRTLSFDALMQSESADLVPNALARDPFLLLYTSGTTSAPKGVPVTYRTFLSNARLSAAELGLTAESVLLSAAPFTHLYGLFTLNLALSVGATTALLPSFTPTDLVEALRAMRPTALFAAPAHIAGAISAGALSGEALESLQFVMLSGSPCPQPLADALQEMMPTAKVLQLWGMSELQAGAFTRPHDSRAVRTTTTGRASPGTSLRVVDVDGRVLAADSIGELQVRGCSVFAGYHDNVLATREAYTPDGWFRTGDLASLDAQGNVRVTGRLKELINRGGVKFNPVDVEAILDRHPAVSQSALVPMPDPVLGERACCFAVLNAGHALTLDEIRAWLTQHCVAKTKWPERLEIIEAMPLTATRKIVRSELIKRLA
jgi:cyclohexanecarboxylate-CoA ligase